MIYYPLVLAQLQILQEAFSFPDTRRVTHSMCSYKDLFLQFTLSINEAFICFVHNGTMTDSLLNSQ